MSFSNDDIKKKINQELQSIRDLCSNLSTKLSNFSKYEIHDNDIQIQSSENDKKVITQLFGKFTTLSISKHLENFVDIKKFENFHDIKNIEDPKKTNKNEYLNEIEFKHYMVNESLNEFDIEKGFKVKVGKEYKFTGIVPENMLKLQKNGITFYYCYNKIDKYKIPYIYHPGGDKNYWIGSDNYLYYVNDENNLVIGEYQNKKQRWKFLTEKN